jgi:hypothetical protein
MQQGTNQTQWFAQRPVSLALNLCFVMLLASAGTDAPAQQTAQAAPLPAATGEPAAQPIAKPGPAIAAPVAALAAAGQSAPQAVLKEDPGKEEARKGDGGLQQGLKLHGHWVIDIKNPDGTLAEHHEFENSIIATGQALMIGLLSGYMTPGQFLVLIAGPTGGNAPCAPVNGASVPCGLPQNVNYYPAVAYCGVLLNCSGGTLAVTPNFGTDLSGPYSLVMSGSITASQTGTIASVQTDFSSCSGSPTGIHPLFKSPAAIATSSPSACVGNVNLNDLIYAAFTSATLSSSVSVTKGQLIQVIVTITFS